MGSNLCKLVCILSLLITIGGNIPSVYAEENQQVVMKKELIATSDSEMVYEKVEYQSLDNGEEVIYIAGNSSATQGELKGYHMEVDLKNNSYKTTKITGEKLNKFISETQYSTENKPTFTANALPLWTYTVTTVTDDPAGADLCKSSHTLRWSGDGTKVYYDSRGSTFWAANPSEFGTHWYVSDHKYTDYSFPVPNRVRSEFYASYYNYDFMDDSLITGVSHRITLTGHEDGQIGKRKIAPIFRTGGGYFPLTFQK